MQRRHLLRALPGLLALPVTLASQAQGPSSVLVEVWKSPTCGCCTDWITHLHQNGFRTRLHDTNSTFFPSANFTSSLLKLSRRTAGFNNPNNL